MNPYELIAEWSSRGWPVLANHLWQATLFSLLALAAAVALRRAPARARYFAWLVALLKFALPSVLLFFIAAQAGVDLSSVSLRDARPEAGAINVSPLLSPVTAPEPFVRSEEPAAQESEASVAATSETTAKAGGFGLTGVAFCLWFAGCALLALSWLRKSYALSASIRGGRDVVTGREADALRRVKSNFGVSREVRLVLTTAVSEPGVWGVLRPVVVLPEGVAGRLDDAELETVFMHELAHVKRWDNLAGNFQRALCCLFWFHPVVWFINRQLLAEREQACDDMVVRRGGSSEVYANGIAKVCRYCLGREAVGLSKVTGSDLKRRVERIISRSAGKRMSLPHALVLSLLTAAAVTLSIASGKAEGVEHSYAKAEPLASETRSEFIVSLPLQRAEAFSQQHQRQARNVPPEVNNPSQPPQKEQASQTTQPDQAIAPPSEANRPSDVQPSNQPDASNDIAPQPESQIPQSQQPPQSQISQPQQPPPDESAAESDADISAAVVPASEVDYGDLRAFVGRYEVDPSRAENFVLDVTLGGGELWLKPSHSKRRRLIRRSETDFVDSYSEYKLTAVYDERGRVVGLKLNSWGRGATARRLSLPQPSLRGNVTFRLRGFPDARVVAVAGEFNKWNQSQFIFSREGGEWVCRVNLPAGTYQYKFIVDGDWLTDPTNPLTVHDERGITNSLLKAE
ncbi:MAG TPA: M56 family metallopeptidase [Pyrinomonadaceae bacterium]|jgi:beta-lactamase regulating signal transducer with metallopeptidase domain|nr:M56 family metallopeptidase [Pyrinomonadaceae bacterium]